MTNYSGTITFTSSDLNAQVPGDTLFNGNGTFPVTFSAQGAQTIMVSDKANANLVGNATVPVGISANDAFVIRAYQDLTGKLRTIPSCRPRRTS